MIDYSNVSTGKLQLRRALGREICRLLRTEWRDEPNAAERLKEYEAKVKAYTEELQRRRKAAREMSGADKPQPVKIRAKVGKMGAKYG